MIAILRSSCLNRIAPTLETTSRSPARLGAGAFLVAEALASRLSGGGRKRSSARCPVFHAEKGRHQPSRDAPRNGSDAAFGQLPLAWRGMSRPGDGLLARLVARAHGMPTERHWERSAVLEPRYAARVPELISDAGGLAFPPSALDQPSKPLDPRDPAVGMLAAQLESRAGSNPLRKSKQPGERRPSSSTLGGWRLIARTDKEALRSEEHTSELQSRQYLVCRLLLE